MFCTMIVLLPPAEPPQTPVESLVNTRKLETPFRAVSVRYMPVTTRALGYRPRLTGPKAMPTAPPVEASTRSSVRLPEGSYAKLSTLAAEELPKLTVATYRLPSGPKTICPGDPALVPPSRLITRSGWSITGAGVRRASSCSHVGRDLETVE